MRNPAYNGIDDLERHEAYKAEVRQERAEVYKDEQDRKKLKNAECCEVCGEEDFSPNIEAFEISGKLLCDECADEVFEENSQFGEGA